jgi:MFS family permease
VGSTSKFGDPEQVSIVLRDRLIEGLPFHYGWVILVSGAIGAFMTLPGQTTGVALFFEPVAADLALSRSQVALAYTLGTLAGALPAPLVGRWIDRRGPRLAAGAIAMAMGLACVVMALTWSALTLTIGFAALRGATIGGLSLVSQHVINLWFVTRRGMAATAASVGVALGGIVFPQVIDALIRTGGWRRAYLTLGVMVAATMLAVGLLLFRDRPERFGLTPDLGAASQRSRVTPEPAFTRAEALRTSVFWTLSLANLLINALGTGLLLNHFDLLSGGGVAREAAVIVFAPLSITQVVAAVGIGPLVDRFVPHRLVVLPMTSMAFACLFVVTVASTTGAFIYAMALGLAYGSFQAINAAVYAHYFGRKHAGEIRGTTFVITIVGAALGPLPFGWASAHGSYFPVLVGGATLCALAALTNLIVKAPSARVVDDDEDP